MTAAADFWTHPDVLTELEERRKAITTNPAHPQSIICRCVNEPHTVKEIAGLLHR
jgi:hypothetical protein